MNDGVSFATVFETPFAGVALTLAIYAFATRLHKRIGEPVWLNPLLIAIVLLASLLAVTRTPYEAYFTSAEMLHILLGPVVVLLSVPLWRRLSEIRRLGPLLVPVLLIGGTTGILSSAGIAWALGFDAETIATLAPKSVTTPVAIGFSDALGGIASLTAVVVILTGLTGATLGLPLLRLFGICDPRAVGLAVGVGAHAIGTARVFQIDAVAGTYASVGMILNIFATAGLLGCAILLSLG